MIKYNILMQKITYNKTCNYVKTYCNVTVLKNKDYICYYSGVLIILKLFDESKKSEFIYFFLLIAH